MKVSMTPKGDGVSKVMLEKDGQVYSFDGYITDFELNYDEDYGDYDFARHLKTRSYTVNMTLSAGAIKVLTPSAMDLELAKKYSSYPQRYVLGADQVPEEVEDVPAPVELQPSDIPESWIEL